MVGLGVPVSTESYGLFCYTILCKAISIRLVFAVIITVFNQQFKLEYFSLSLFNVLCIICMGGIHYYYDILFLEVGNVAWWSMDAKIKTD